MRMRVMTAISTWKQNEAYEPLPKVELYQHSARHNCRKE